MPTRTCAGVHSIWDHSHTPEGHRGRREGGTVKRGGVGSEQVYLQLPLFKTHFMHPAAGVGRKCSHWIHVC